MNLPAKAICAALCSATLLAPLVPAQVLRGKPLAPSDPRVRRPAMKAKFGPLQNGPTISNPNAVSHDAAIIASLEKQKQAAVAEAAQMKLSTRPASRSSVPSGPSHTMSAPGSNGRAVVPVDTTAITCGSDPTMRILNVSGNAAPATFSPDTKYNFYTIQGCSFADIGPSAQVYIYKGSTFHEQFQIQEWHENWIKLNLDPTLSGFPDVNDLTLVVQRADGKQASKGGFKFYAARQTTHLSHIPKDDFSLNRFTPNDTSHLQDYYNSPSAHEIVPGLPGIPGHTSEVYWQCIGCIAINGHSDNVYMTGNEDIYKFNQLQPGFVVAQSGMAYRNLDCTGVGPLHTEGQFATRWVGSDLHVTWQGQMCVDEGCGGFGQGDCFGSGQSDYVVDVWGSGPRCIDPWTGQPDQNCIASVRAGKSN